jgi:uncharacterized Zn finger protein
MSFYGWKPYVSVAERRKKAEKAAAKARKGGADLSPVAASRGAIAKTFWGKGWCRNLECYSDFANRLPRGRTYVRNGSVIDLKITNGEVRAKVMGSSLYNVNVTVVAVPGKQWRSISADCAGSIDSLVELLQGRLSNAVMERICRPNTGLFPAPKEIKFSCSCPDWASMCKHVAAVLYGVGARLDSQPELIFALRRVDPKDLVARAGAGLRRSGQSPPTGKVLDDAHLADVFGIEMADVAPAKKPAAPHHASTATRMKTAPATKAATTVAPGATRKAPAAGKTEAAKAALAQKAAMAKVPAKKSSNTPSRIGKARLAAMIEAATVDAYGESEQTTGWYTMLEEHLALPFDTTLLGVVVRVARLDLRGGNDIVAICTRGRKRQSVSILDLPLPSPKPVGAEWIEAYRHWVGG